MSEFVLNEKMPLIFLKIHFRTHTLSNNQEDSLMQLQIVFKIVNSFFCASVILTSFCALIG